MTPALIIHGGAGAISPPDLHAARHQGLRRAFASAWTLLLQGSSAVDAAVRATVVLENDPVFNAGVGSCLTQDGTIEMDASLMDGATFQTGAVGAVRNVRNPILLASALMEANHHVFLVGEGAERFAGERNMPVATLEELTTERQRQRWRTAQTQGERGTVGAVALDRVGQIAAATSTGGTVLKQSGRIGDSAVIGAGTYADSTLGACSATGDGEAIIRATLARTAVELLRDGKDPAQAAQTALAFLHERTGGEAGLILVDPFGRIGYAYNTPAMGVAYISPEQLMVLV